LKYSEEELNIIQEKIPEFIPKPRPSINTAIIAFLKKHEVFDQLPKDITYKEWLSIKQGVLDDKDFPKFRTDYFIKVTEYNQKISKKLDSPKLQKELNSLIKNYLRTEKIRQYVNPFYFYCKCKKNAKNKGEKIFNKINTTLWFWFVVGIFIVLIITSL